MNTPKTTSTDTTSQNSGYSVTPLFPSLILRTTVPEYEQLLPLAYEQRDKHDGLMASNMGGWHSPLQPIPELLHQYMPFPKWGGVCWYMINCNLQGNYSHTHPNNDWAGVLWLKVPPNAAKLEFEHPDCFAQYDAIQSIHDNNPTIQQQTNYYKAYSFTPKEGQLLMFPSSLRHRVYFSNTNEERISMSFNIKIDET